ncbi:hypothetical protein FALCPG4_014960 [Fusarium falciforme]
MSCLGLSEEVGLEAYLDGLDVDDDGDDQEEAREYISPFSVDEHYLEEPTSLGSSAASTEESTEQFQRGWRINRHAGDSWMYADEFIAETNDEAFDGARALDLLQRRVVIDYGSKKTGSRPASEEDEYYPVFRLDFVSIVGRPRRPICRASHFFDNITISLRHWNAPYSAKHVQGIHFDLSGRTFRIATGATREAWFIVMHPIQRASSGNGNPHHRRHDTSYTRTALVHGRALLLASYIKDIFLRGELLGEGVEPRWALGGAEAQMIAFDKWVTFQTRFMEGWEEFIDGLSARGGDTFWLDHQPAFHAYDYGANIKIEVNEEIANLEQETVIRSAHLHSEMDDDDDDDDGWEILRQGREQHGEEEEEDGDGDGDGDQYPHPNAEDSLFLPVEAHSAASLSPSSHLFRPDRSEMMMGRRRLEDEVGHDEEHDLPAAAGAGRIVMATSAPLSGGHSHRPEDEEEGGNGEVFGDDDEQEERFIRWMNESEGAVMTHSTGVAEAQQQQQGEEEGGLTHQHRSDGDEEEEEEDHHRGPHHHQVDRENTTLCTAMD